MDEILSRKKLAGWMDGWMDGWVDGWMDGWKSRVKDCLQQSKNVGKFKLSIFDQMSKFLCQFHVASQIDLFLTS